MQAVWCHLSREHRVHHARLDDGELIDDVDFEDAAKSVEP